MKDNIVCIATFNPKFNEYLTKKLDVMAICQSIGLIKHIKKRHPECMGYVPLLPEIIASPDYIGVNPIIFTLPRCIQLPIPSSNTAYKMAG